MPTATTITTAPTTAAVVVREGSNRKIDLFRKPVRYVRNGGFHSWLCACSLLKIPKATTLQSRWNSGFFLSFLPSQEAESSRLRGARLCNLSALGARCVPSTSLRPCPWLLLALHADGESNKKAIYILARYWAKKHLASVYHEYTDNTVRISYVAL